MNKLDYFISDVGNDYPEYKNFLLSLKRGNTNSIEDILLVKDEIFALIEFHFVKK